ncbi:BioY family [Sulfitobacter noctilucae]|uniref:biotin transporter BioY n=1 Tax=Sulfitobacter noctilucae TaxID=1342302 RepID=UPI00046AAB5A|nr:BioY family transporter [Sulfitobacter noctilucae]KIN65378.1 BioY family [Sulfitobacter noctilucae]
MERQIALIAVFAALIAALGLMPTLMLASGVPISAQSLGVMLCGTVLGATRGGLAALLFVVLVALGLPLLAGGRGGLGAFASPTVGFIVGFPIAAFTTGYIMEQTRRLPVGVAAAVAAAVGGIIVLYIFGIAGFMLVLQRGLLETIGILGVYIPGDLIKVVLTALITAGLLRARPGSVLSRQS